MRIRCERCKAEYEVDEHQMHGGHLEVQCSVCAHVFSVSKQTGTISPSPAPEDGLWLVRKVDGRTMSFANLAALSRAIQNGTLEAQDKVTRDQRSWRTLGEVPELGSTFSAVALGQSGEQRGCEPQMPAAANETSRFVVEPKSHGMVKVSVGLAVAAGVAFAGIRWQQDRTLQFQSPPAHAAAKKAAVPVPAVEPVNAELGGAVAPAPAPSSAAIRGPVVEELPSPSHPAPAAKKEHAPAASAGSPQHSAEGYDRLVAEADRALVNGSTNRAKDLYQKALSQRPAGFKALAGLGFVALDRGQLPAAYDFFKRALTAKTSFPPALFGIAEVHRARGEKSLAVHSYQRYLDMAPDGADAPAARRQLQNLRAGR
jgi:predicted Zn finger-like uncharacterized protein